MSEPSDVHWILLVKDLLVAIGALVWSFLRVLITLLLLTAAAGGVIGFGVWVALSVVKALVG